jgi:hypothetical protein
MRITFPAWMAHGGFSADEPETYAAWRHFYDPYAKSGGVKYLTDHVPDGWMINPQIDAKTWALTHSENPYCFEAAKENYRKAFEGEGTAADTEASFAKAFRGVGETMHLLADMVQPAHVRNDSHAFSEPIETNLSKAMVQELAAGEVDSRVSFANKSVPELFDELAVFTNEHFSSNDTIYNAASPRILPANGQTPNDKPQFSDLEWDENKLRYYGIFCSDSRKVRMAFQALSSYEARKNGYPNEAPTYLSASFYTREQASVLVPLAVKGNAEIIRQFFPQLKLKISKTSAGSDAVSISGEMVHETGDSAWSTPLKYSGPGSLIKRTPSGGEGGVIAEATFKDGKVVEPVKVNLTSDEPKVFWQVRVGGLIVESADLKLSSGAEEDICPPDSFEGTDTYITNSVCVDNQTIYYCSNGKVDMCLGCKPEICENGCFCDANWGEETNYVYVNFCKCNE